MTWASPPSPKGLGARAERVATLDKFDHALVSALADGRPTLIDAHVDPDEIP